MTEPREAFIGISYGTPGEPDAGYLNVTFDLEELRRETPDQFFYRHLWPALLALLVSARSKGFDVPDLGRPQLTKNMLSQPVRAVEDDMRHLGGKG